MRRSPEEEEVMFGKQIRLKRFLGGIVVTAAVGVVVVPAAFSTTSSRGGTASATQIQVQPNRFTSDTLASNDGLPIPVNADNPNGYEPATVVGYGRTPAPVATGSPSGTGPNWKDIGIGAGFVAALLLLLLASTQMRNGRRRGVTTA